MIGYSSNAPTCCAESCGTLLDKGSLLAGSLIHPFIIQPGYLRFYALYNESAAMDPENGEVALPLCPANVGKTISLSLSELAARVGMAADGMREHSRSPYVQRLLLGILEVHAKATEVWGDDNRAAGWMLGVPIHALGGKSAIALIAEERTPDVLCYLDALEPQHLRCVG